MSELYQHTHQYTRSSTAPENPGWPVAGASDQQPHSGALGVDGGSKAALARLRACARLGEHYWLEAIELCKTKKQRMSLAREIAELAKAAASNAANEPRR